MPAPPPPAPLPGLTAALSEGAQEWLDQAVGRLTENPSAALPELFPQLPRRLGREPVGVGRHRIEDREIDLGAWRCCDAAALLLLETARASEDLLLDLFYHGDMEEKTMLLRAMAARSVDHATVTLLGEAQRTNTAPHLEAAVCDSNLLARAVEHEEFGLDGFNRMVLKIAFVDLPLTRLFGAERIANPDLSRSLQDLATEREAAGRRVWRDTNLLIARAPTAGTRARLAGGLEHGDDSQRLSAAKGLRYLQDDALRALARERLDREPVATIHAAITEALKAPG